MHILTVCFKFSAQNNQVFKAEQILFLFAPRLAPLFAGYPLFSLSVAPNLADNRESTKFQK